MNIIQAREAALAGKTVICPSGLELVADDFDDMKTISHDMVFGEWRVRQEPVVFETKALASRMNEEHGAIDFHSEVLINFIGKRVKVSVEVIE